MASTPTMYLIYEIWKITDPGFLDPKTQQSGPVLFSATLPISFWYQDDEVTIVDGQLRSGRVRKSSLIAILDTIERQYDINAREDLFQKWMTLIATTSTATIITDV